MAGWVPRGVDPVSRDVLVDGVPPWMRPTLLDWLKPHFTQYWSFSGEHRLDSQTFLPYDLVSRIQPSYASKASGSPEWPGFVGQLDAEQLLDLADWVSHEKGQPVAGEFERILENAGSVWMLGNRNGNLGLVRRMPEVVQTAAEEAISQGTAGALLGEAWSAAYGRGPDPEEAYEKSIKAVEEALAPLVAPKNDRATLGTIIRDMKAQRSWTIDLPGEDAYVVVSMCSALWTGQESRHGGNAYRKPTQAEAETAVILAVALVQLASSGSVARRPKADGETRDK